MKRMLMLCRIDYYMYLINILPQKFFANFGIQVPYFIGIIKTTKLDSFLGLSQPGITPVPNFEALYNFICNH